jgi:hypothetical protein
MAITTGHKAAARKTSGSAAFPSQEVKHLPSLGEIKKAPMGKAAIEKLVAAGAEPDRLGLAVQFVVLVQIMPGVKIQDVRGFSRESLTLFSEELRRTATHIEMIRGNPFYVMALNLFLPGPHWEKTCKNLRAYADFWDALIRGIRQAAEDNPREYDLRLFSKRRLMAEIARATGRPPHYNRLAHLLNAAYDAAGLPLREEASALRHLWQNHVKKNAQRRYRKMALMMD